MSYKIKAVICRKLRRFRPHQENFKVLRDASGDYRAFGNPDQHWTYQWGVGRGLGNWWITEKVVSL